NSNQEKRKLVTVIAPGETLLNADISRYRDLVTHPGSSRVLFSRRKIRCITFCKSAIQSANSIPELEHNHEFGTRHDSYSFTLFQFDSIIPEENLYEKIMKLNTLESYNFHVPFSVEFTFPALPERGPEITGLSEHYAVGENVTANCTAWPSIPKADLRWTINGETVKRVVLDCSSDSSSTSSSSTSSSSGGGGGGNVGRISHDRMSKRS
ncbi:hypothetical protein V1477_013322, partial [Vespula maculifrons]